MVRRARPWLRTPAVPVRPEQSRRGGCDRRQDAARLGLHASRALFRGQLAEPRAPRIFKRSTKRRARRRRQAWSATPTASCRPRQSVRVRTSESQLFRNLRCRPIQRGPTHGSSTRSLCRRGWPGSLLQADAWNTNIDLGGSCYAMADLRKACAWYNHGRNDQSLVERRLYYDEARWGYSTSILAWELVNEYPASKLTPFWNGATVDVNGVPNIPGVVSWLRIITTRRTRTRIPISSRAYMFINVAESSV